MPSRRKADKLNSYLKEICALEQLQQMKERLCQLMDQGDLSKEEFLNLSFLVFQHIEQSYGKQPRMTSRAEVLREPWGADKEVIYLTGLSVKGPRREPQSTDAEEQEPRCYFCGRSPREQSLAFKWENGRAWACSGELQLLPVIRKSRDGTFMTRVCHECYVVLNLSLEDRQE